MGSFICSVCDTSFSAKSSLKLHEASIHKGVRFSCQVCGEQFKQKGNLTRHFNSFHNPEQTEYKWNQCDKEFNSQSARLRHIEGDS